jgi:hypothetical protein
VRRADRLLIAPPPPCLHNGKEGLDLRERKVDLVLEEVRENGFRERRYLPLFYPKEKKIYYFFFLVY